MIMPAQPILNAAFCPVLKDRYKKTNPKTIKMVGNMSLEGEISFINQFFEPKSTFFFIFSINIVEQV